MVTIENDIPIGHRRGRLFVISGPSGAGKTTLCKQLVARISNLTFSVSYTTRPPREGEVDGKDYSFVTNDAFHEMIKGNEFIEWAKVYEHFYGTHRNTVIQSLDEGTDLVVEIDEQGAMQLKKAFEEGVFIYLFPPTLATLRTRLEHRGKDSQESIQMRLERAKDEIQHFGEYTYFTVNNELEQSLKQLEAVVIAERMKTAYVNQSSVGEQCQDHQKEA